MSPSAVPRTVKFGFILLWIEAPLESLTLSRLSVPQDGLDFLEFFGPSTASRASPV